jgi:hypothetical protein
VAGGASPETALEALERFTRALSASEPEDLVRLTLAAVLEAVGADAAYWHPGVHDEPIERTGTSPVTAAWCREFKERAVAQASNSPTEVLITCLDPASRPLAPWPCSAALVRVSRNTGSWLAALSFHPRRLFGPTDLRVLHLIRRMCLNRRRQDLDGQRCQATLARLEDRLSGALDDVALDGDHWGRRLGARLRQCLKDLQSLRR